MCFPSRVGATAPQYNPHQHFLSQGVLLDGAAATSGSEYVATTTGIEFANKTGLVSGTYAIPQQQQQQQCSSWSEGTSGIEGVAEEAAAACLVAEAAASCGDKRPAPSADCADCSGLGCEAPAPKPKKKRKRKRKMLQPGLTATHQERHFVVHNYHDHANDAEEDYALPAPVTGQDGGFCAKVAAASAALHGACGGAHHALPFPLKLHAKLDEIEREGFASIVSWQPHGRCFVVHKPKDFADKILPRFFGLGKVTSFQRQLNLYGFTRLSKGKDQGGYYHEMFLRGKPFLCRKMVRTKTKGTKFKAASSPDSEPDFYSMPPVQMGVVTAPTSPLHAFHPDPHDGDDEREEEEMHNTVLLSPKKSENNERKHVVSTPPPHPLPQQQVVVPTSPMVPVPPTTSFPPAFVTGAMPMPPAPPVNTLQGRGASPTHVSDDDAEHNNNTHHSNTGNYAMKYDPALQLEGMDPFEPIPVDPERVGLVAKTAESVLAQEFADCDWSYLFCDTTTSHNLTAEKADLAAATAPESWNRQVSEGSVSIHREQVLSQAPSFDADMDPLDAFVKQTMKIDDDGSLANYLDLLVE